MKPSETFVKKLKQLEESHTPDPLLDLFTEQSKLMRLNSDEFYEGREGARSFWNEYLSLFKEIRSSFTNIIDAGNTAVLEWEAEGLFESGEPIRYRGISVVEFDGEKVRGFRSYYDSERFTQTAHA